jgi:origin recognition complex subunit 4
VNGRRKRNRADHNENGTASTLVDRHELGIELGGTAETEERQDELVLDHINGNMQDNYDQSDHAAESAEALEDTNPFISTRAKGQPATSLSKDTQADLNTVLEVLKNIVMQRLTAKRPIPLLGLDAEYKNVYQLVENTVSAGEGNSMLLIGARGSGKSALVSQVLSEISKEYRQDFHTVKLNGFIHTDDKLALRDIWRQLGKEMELEEDSMGKNYADTLSKLLALLSHPSEQIGEDTEQVAKAVVFVMDEFDLFALHPRQTLLYNLFDIAQSRKAPITVLGLTTRVDVSEGLEKRVKSRFSHRYVHLSLPKTFSAFQEVCKAALLLQLDELSVEERAVLTTSTLPTPKKVKHLDPIDILAAWNSCISVISFLPQPLSFTELTTPDPLCHKRIHNLVPRSDILPQQVHQRSPNLAPHACRPSHPYQFPTIPIRLLRPTTNLHIPLSRPRTPRF